MANFVTFGSEDNELTVNTDEICSIRKYETEIGGKWTQRRLFRKDKLIEDTRRKAVCISITFKNGAVVSHYDADLTAMEFGHDALLDALECLNTTP